jgi:hypothetical protein
MEHHARLQVGLSGRHKIREADCVQGGFMKDHFAVIAILLCLNSVQSVLAAESSEGIYTNNKVKIEVDVGPRGGDELRSSVCKGKIFYPKYDGQTGMFSDPKGGYAIGFGGNYIHMDVEGTHRCFPEGRYRKVKR